MSPVESVQANILQTASSTAASSKEAICFLRSISRSLVVAVASRWYILGDTLHCTGRDCRAALAAALQVGDSRRRAALQSPPTPCYSGSRTSTCPVVRCGAQRARCAGMSGPPNVVLYSTTTPATSKVKADIARVKRILDNKRVSYEEVGGLWLL